MDAPETHYAKTEDGVHIAYQVFGQGTHDLVVHLPWLSNVDACWDVPDWATLLRGFGRFARVILFDRRGMGVSDRPTSVDAMAIEKGMEDLRAVLDDIGSERPALLGYESGGTVMILFAASHPDRVAALALSTPAVSFWKTPEFPWGTELEYATHWRAMTETSWGSREFWLENWRDISDRPLSDHDVRVWARMTRLCASPQGAVTIDEVERQIEIRAVLPQIQVPTLVMRSRFDREHEFWEETPWVAEQIPGARYVELPSPDHIPFQPEAYAELETFLSQIHRHEAVFDRVLATVLFTDIVDSTVQSAALGDREWRGLREEHDRVVRAQLSRYRGHEVKTMGDGFLATFDGPARAVYCAQAIAEHVRALGIEVRSGLHTGEVELDGDDVRGIAVAIGARVGAKAGPSEVLVSQTVKDLVAGSGLSFEDAGEHELKGVPGAWRLYRVEHDGTQDQA